MSARAKSRGLIYLRRSGDRQESSLQCQFEWALKAAQDQGVHVDASLDDLKKMQAEGLCRHKSIRLDDAVSGSELQRPGLDVLQKDVVSDQAISHLFVYRRDRLGRPNDPVDMMLIEQRIRCSGVTIVRSDGIAEPVSSGNSDIGELVRMLVEYESSGDFLRQLSERVLRAQLQLARAGRWTGGNAPYGFTRALVDADGRILEKLLPGKSVRQPGCHVVIVPDDKEKVQRWLHILMLKEQGWGYKRIANHLNEQGIPSPGAGSYRTDHGVRHEVSGRWNHTTVRDICRNRAILGIIEYGRRSEGKHWRTDPDGSRPLNEDDLRDGKAQRIFNKPEKTVRGTLPFEPQFDADQWERIQDETRKRSRSQAGVPRTRDPARYPLSCRVIDLTDDCYSVMYARTIGKRRVYTCGRYMRTGGRECDNNQVDAEAALQFTLLTLVELVDRLGAHDELRARLMQRAQAAQADNPGPDPYQQQTLYHQQQVETLRRQLASAQRNLATEEEPALRDAVRDEYRRIASELKDAEQELAALNTRRPSSAASSPEAEVDAALRLFADIRRVATNPDARADILPLVQKLGLRLGLNYVEATKGKNRKIRRLAGGELHFGDRLLPFQGHRRPRPAGADVPGCDPSKPQPSQNIKETTGAQSPVDPNPLQVNLLTTNAPQESISFTKVSRGDWI